MNLRSVRKALKPFLIKILRFSPVKKDKVVFLNYDGKGYGDNAKYIADEFIRRRVPCRLVWIVDGEADVPENIKKVVGMNGLSAFYELSSAKVIVNNCKFSIPSGFRKKRKQFYLQTWHGDFPLKYIEKEVEDQLPVSYLTKSKAESAITDAAVSGCPLFSRILRESFWLPENCTILEYGVPRNDIYFRGDAFREELKRRYGFSSDDRVLLYAPTFRDDGETDCYNLDFERLRKSLCRSTGAEWKIIVRLHPNISSRADLFHYDERIINGSACSDQMELCMIADCLITDYSSIMGDFFLMDKPVFLYVPDWEHYKTSCRRMRDMFYELPLPLLFTQDELEARMEHFDRETYDRDIAAFMDKYYRPFSDGHSSERVVDYLLGVMRLHG